MEKEELLVVAHPMPGWISVMPIPVQEEVGEGEGEGEEEAPMLVIGPFAFPAALPRPEAGIEAGIVIEMGETSSAYPVPFSEHSKVFYPDDRGIQVGDRRFLTMANVIAWTDD